MRVEQLTPRELDYKEVKFSAKISKSEYCCCDGCHRQARVTKIIMPETKYFNHEQLRTIYESYWFCDSCMEKLKAAIENPVKEK